MAKYKAKPCSSIIVDSCWGKIVHQADTEQTNRHTHTKKNPSVHENDSKNF